MRPWRSKATGQESPSPRVQSQTKRKWHLCLIPERDKVLGNATESECAGGPFRRGITAALPLEEVPCRRAADSLRASQKSDGGESGPNGGVTQGEGVAFQENCLRIKVGGSRQRNEHQSEGVCENDQGQQERDFPNAEQTQAVYRDPEEKTPTQVSEQRPV